jgi:hypothetical protein
MKKSMKTRVINVVSIQYHHLFVILYTDELIHRCEVALETMGPFKNIKQASLSRPDVPLKQMTWTHKCLYCELCSKTKKSLMKHIADVHIDIAITCKRCNMQFASQTEKQQHHEKVHPKCNHKCMYCNHCGFVSKSALRCHVSKVHRLKAIRCKYPQKCFELFFTEQDKNEHIKNMHPNRFKCNYCINSVFFKSGHLREHVFKYHRISSIKCKYSTSCSQYFQSEQDRDMHVSEVHVQVKAEKDANCKK